MEEETNRHLCPCCGKCWFESYNSLEICDVCYWQDDAVQNEDLDYMGGANPMSLNQAKTMYKMYGNTGTELWEKNKDEIIAETEKAAEGK